jgi:hypothetical protein
MPNMGTYYQVELLMGSSSEQVNQTLTANPFSVDEIVLYRHPINHRSKLDLHFFPYVVTDIESPHTLWVQRKFTKGPVKRAFTHINNVKKFPAGDEVLDRAWLGDEIIVPPKSSIKDKVSQLKKKSSSNKEYNDDADSESSSAAEDSANDSTDSEDEHIVLKPQPASQDVPSDSDEDVYVDADGSSSEHSDQMPKEHGQTNHPLFEVGDFVLFKVEAPTGRGKTELKSRIGKVISSTKNTTRVHAYGGAKQYDKLLSRRKFLPGWIPIHTDKNVDASRVQPLFNKKPSSKWSKAAEYEVLNANIIDSFIALTPTFTLPQAFADKYAGKP